MLCFYHDLQVALFARAWIEIINGTVIIGRTWVALFARAWIEIPYWGIYITAYCVAPFARAWIEISFNSSLHSTHKSPSLRGRGLKSTLWLYSVFVPYVALFARAWIEIQKGCII